MVKKVFINKSKAKCLFAVMLSACVVGWAAPSGHIWPKKKKKQKTALADTISMTTKLQDVGQTHRMLTSTYPVHIQVTMNAVQIQSDHSQILPIYTQSGTFYMAARLNKGTNWINGLPKGSYFINNRPIKIN